MIIRINMKTKTVITEEIPAKYFLLGGRGLTSRILLDEVDPLCYALGANNKLIIATGLLGGTSAPSSGRLSIGAKSPLTDGIKESNAGGTVAVKLSKLGIRAVILEDQPDDDETYILTISKNETKIVPASWVRGLENYQLTEKLLEQYGKYKSIISIGPAGERQYSSASIAITDMEGRPSRHCGRGGMGAVMGSKKVKAIVVDDNSAPGVKYHDIDSFKSLAKEWAQVLIQTKKTFTEYGTNSLVKPVNALGILPTRNFSTGSFEKAELIDGDSLKNTITDRGGKHGLPCHPGCVIRCSNIYKDKQGNYVTSALEYETIALLGPNCGIADLDLIANFDRFCDEFGIDTMELGISLGVIMEAGIIPFGSGEKALEIIEQIREDTYLGKMIGHGAYITGKVLGVKRVPVVKKQGIAAYDPRGLKGTGVTYATSPMGGDHTAGNCLPGRVGYRTETQREYDVRSAQYQSELSKDVQIMTAVCDYCGLCFFVGPTADSMERIAALLNAKLGTNLNSDDVIRLGKELLSNEVEFNNRAGIPQSTNGLPEFFTEERLDTTGSIFDVPRNELGMIFG